MGGVRLYVFTFVCYIICKLYYAWSVACILCFVLVVQEAVSALSGLWVLCVNIVALSQALHEWACTCECKEWQSYCNVIPCLQPWTALRKVSYAVLELI